MRLSDGMVCRMNWRDVIMFCCRILLAWSKAILESVSIMYGYWGGIASSAMIMAISSATLMDVWVVPYPGGRWWSRVISGMVGRSFQDLFCCRLSIAIRTIAAAELCSSGASGGVFDL